MKKYSHKGGSDIWKLAKGRVLILNAEDDPAKTMRPRLEKAGANLEPNRIHFQGRFKPLTKEGIQVLEAKIHSFKPDLVIIDPILTYMGSEVDSNRFNEVTEFLTYIDQLARDHNICIVGIKRAIESLVDREISNTKRQLQSGQFALDLEIEETFREKVIHEGFDVRYGARPLKRAWNEFVVNPMSEWLLSQSSRKIKQAQKIVASQNGTVVPHFELVV